jgi:hypothetical protein
MNPQMIQLKDLTLEELQNLKDQATAQIAINIANDKVAADRLKKQKDSLNKNILAIQEAIEALPA